MIGDASLRASWTRASRHVHTCLPSRVCWSWGSSGDRAAGWLDQVDDDRMRGAAGADRRHRVLPSRAPAYRAARAARWVAALTPLSVDGMIVAASATLLAYARAGRRGERAHRGAIVIDPGWLSSLEYQRVDVPALGFEAEADGKRAVGLGPGPATDDRDQAVRVVPAHHRVVDLQQPPGFLGDRGEHLLWRRSARDKGRHPAQRRLLLGEPAQLYARLRVGDRGRD